MSLLIIVFFLFLYLPIIILSLKACITYENIIVICINATILMLLILLNLTLQHVHRRRQKGLKKNITAASLETFLFFKKNISAKHLNCFRVKFKWPTLCTRPMYHFHSEKKSLIVFKNTFDFLLSDGVNL